jgi:hypothetical protein
VSPSFCKYPSGNSLFACHSEEQGDEESLGAGDYGRFFAPLRMTMWSFRTGTSSCEYRSIMDLQLGGNLVSFQADRNREFGVGQDCVFATADR